jgi:DNA mismatch repair protein MutS
LSALENQSAHGTDQFDLFAIESENAESASTISDPALTALHELDPDTLSPREALDALYRLKKLSSQG